MEYQHEATPLFCFVLFFPKLRKLNSNSQEEASNDRDPDDYNKAQSQIRILLNIFFFNSANLSACIPDLQAAFLHYYFTSNSPWH